MPDIAFGVIAPPEFIVELGLKSLGPCGVVIAFGVIAPPLFTGELGLKGLEGNLLKSAVGSNLIGFSNPLSAAFTVGSLLPDSVKGIAGLLRGKRAEKAIAKDIIADRQGFKDTTISPKITNMQPTGRDKGMGSGGKPSNTASTPSKSYSGANPYGGGAGGLHSGYK